MLDDTTKTYETDFFMWFTDRLKDKGLQFSRCGFKTSLGPETKHDIDPKTGFWQNPAYSGTKPPRWLYHINVGDDGVAATNPVPGTSKPGAINTSQEDKTGVVFRLLPLVRLNGGDFLREDRLEVYVLFVFHGATPQGSSSERFEFDTSSGELRYQDKTLPYIAGGLLGIRSSDWECQFTSDGQIRTITYGETVGALATDINFAPEGGVTVPMPVFDLSRMDELDRLKKTIADAWETSDQNSHMLPPDVEDDDDSDEDDVFVTTALPHIWENPELIGIDQGVYRRINAAIQSGKQHIMLYGPPGTGKTTLARWIATRLMGGAKWTLITGSSDWSSQEIIGGYQPTGGGSIAFVPGVLLRDFDRPLIIDELNRCDIDKVIGPIFTVLSGHLSTLPYRVKIEDPKSPQYVILPEPKDSSEKHEFAPGKRWRLIATINSIDKAALYQMSYALSRRFGWVYVDAPRDTAGFVADYLKKKYPEVHVPEDRSICPLATFWRKVNEIRVIGPAPIIDAIEAVRVMGGKEQFFDEPSREMSEMLLDAIDMVLLPMLDGIGVHEAEELAETAVAVFKLDQGSAERIRARMKSVLE